MKKKQLLEQLAALKLKRDALLAVTEPENITEHLAAAKAADAEVVAVQEQLDALEKLEAMAKANATREPATVHNNAEDRPFKSSADFFSAVIGAGKAALNGGPIDPRLQKLASGANESIDSEGGFLVDVDTSNELMQRAYTVGTLASKCRQIPISAGANGTKINGVDETSRANGSRYGGIQSYWASEAATVTATQPKFRRIELYLKKLFALAYATEEQLADGPQLQAFINDNVPQEIAFKLDDAILNGTGAGQPLGILTSAAYVSQAAEAAQTATTLNAANISKMFGRMWAGSMPKAEWFMNQDVWQQLPQMTLANMPIYAPNFTVSPYGTLFGKPINIIEQAATLGTLGDVSLMDLSQYALATKGGVKQAVSMHVRFLYDEQVFKFTMRVDGQPMWNAPLTPFKGSATQSPFIFLAAR
jgi:HK97 family phage major capsid protein